MKKRFIFILCIYHNQAIILFSIDASKSQGIAKFINDSPSRYANAIMRIITFNNEPNLILYSKKYITKNEEIRYDYQASSLWWRKNVSVTIIYLYLMKQERKVCNCNFVF